MIYVFDSCTFIKMFTHFRPETFPSFWIKFNEYLDAGKIISVREAYNELGEYDDDLGEWAKKKIEIFKDPTPEELAIVAKIFENKHFEGLIGPKKILAGGFCADPFILASAKHAKGCVVTEDGFNKKGEIKENSPQLAPACKSFEVDCINFQSFMMRENWSW